MVIPNREDNILSVFILDVGDGDSIIIELPKMGSERKYIIIDCNKADTTLKFLNELNAKHLSLVVSTHPHADHVRGLENIVKEFDISNDKSVNMIWDSGFYHYSQSWLEYMVYILENRPEIQFMRPASGLSFNISGVEIEVLAPSIYLRNRYDSYGTNINNASIVLKLTYGKNKIILAGDAQWDSWAKISEEYLNFKRTTSSDQLIKESPGTDPLKCNLFKVSHHGSKHGTSLEIIERLKPAKAVISCKSGSRIKHKLTMGALDEIETKIFETNNGSLMFMFSGIGAKKVKRLENYEAVSSDWNWV